jgi:hypothetical protein
VLKQLQDQKSTTDSEKIKIKYFSHTHACTHARTKQNGYYGVDSHSRGCATEVSNNLGTTLQLTDTVMPGARIHFISSEALTLLADK